jgi:hypothetical protein
MNHWNYRIIKQVGQDGMNSFGIHEVYYNDKNEIQGFTEESIVPACPTIEGIFEEFELMKKAKDLPTLDMINLIKNQR